MCFLTIDNKRFNANHITFVEAKEFSRCDGTTYRVFIMSQPEGYTCDTVFKNRKACQEYIDQCLGDTVVDNYKDAMAKEKVKKAQELKLVDFESSLPATNDWDWELEDHV